MAQKYTITLFCKRKDNENLNFISQKWWMTEKCLFHFRILQVKYKRNAQTYQETIKSSHLLKNVRV
jgi:hypothetical protein